MSEDSSASVREIVGRNIEDLRKGAGLSQSALGSRLGQWLEAAWSRQAVSLAEQGKRAFGVDDLVGLSVALRVSLWELLMPPAGIEAVVLTSDVTMPSTLFEKSVVGGVGNGGESQRDRLVGHLEELESLAQVVFARQESLKEHLAGLGAQEEHTSDGNKLVIRFRPDEEGDAVKHRAGSEVSAGKSLRTFADKSTSTERVNEDA